MGRTATAKTLAISGPTSSSLLDVCGAVFATCLGNALKTNTESTPSCRNCTLVEGEKPHPVSYQDCIHEKGEEHKELPRDLLEGRSSLSSPHQSSLRSCTLSRHTIWVTTGTADIWEKRVRRIWVGQGEARHIKYRRLKLGGGQAYDRSSE
jgi:hypothetical protein